MDARDKLVVPAREPEAPPAGAATLTVSLSTEALGALGVYLRAGGARGMAFERALLEALGPAAGPEPQAAKRRLALSQRTLRKVQEFIEANLERDIRVADIARAACLSPHHLGHSYRQATGLSVWQDVLRRRARRARTLIDSRPDCSLADIAVLCGFESYSQFIAAFRKAWGLTPGRYRRQLDPAQQSAGFQRSPHDS